MKTTVLVEQLLQKYPRCRDSDKDLIIGVLQLNGANLSESQRQIIRDLNFESVRRVRQKLQEQGKYAPSPAVAKQRRLKSYIVQQNAPTATAQQLGGLVEA